MARKHAVPPRRRGAIVFSALLGLALPQGAAAQRSIYWDALDVAATLDADGVLQVAESQSIVFNGGWNGGERIFNLRPRQTLTFDSIAREDTESGRLIELEENSGLYAVDQYAFTDRRTLRWRSRLTTDPLFEQTRLRYILRYQLAGVVRKDGDRYELDHDFAFPDREGMIRQFTLRLALDPAWQAETPPQALYTAGPLEPGRSFVLTIPMRYAGVAAPNANDGRRPDLIVYAVLAIVGFFVVSAMRLYARERRLGRFDTISVDSITPEWIRQHIVSQPAEVVGAVWDDGIGTPEVVALLARLTAEGKIDSHVREGTTDSLLLTLKVDRRTLADYERALIDGLFFDGRTSTSTDEVRAHYRTTGFHPINQIASGLRSRVQAFLPDGENPPLRPWPTVALFVIGLGLLVKGGLDETGETPVPFLIGVAALVLAGFLQIPGLQFRTYVDRGLRSMVLSLVPAALVSVGVSAFLWYWVGTDKVLLSPMLVAAMVVLTLWMVRASFNSMKSRQHRAAIAVRKTLTAGRRFFERELQAEQPKLVDAWYPWLVAFGLATDVDKWTVHHASRPSRSSHPSSSGSSSFGSSASSSWTGAGGGRSGGAGASAAWASAAAGMAAGVSPPSSSGSGGGGGSSSSGGSSGGGGGGGW